MNKSTVKLNDIYKFITFLVVLALGITFLVNSRKISIEENKAPETDMNIPSFPVSYTNNQEGLIEGVENSNEDNTRSDAKILIFGDTAMITPLNNMIEDPSFDPLANVSEKFQKYDYVVGNHESTIDGDKVGIPQAGKAYTFSTPARAVELYKNAGIDAFSYANNHAKDYGAVSVTHTIKLLNEAGIETFGAGANTTEAFKPLTKEINGNIISFLGYNCAEYAYNQSGPNEPGTAYYSEALVKESILKAKEISDIVIVIPHCGAEQVTTPNDIQKKWAKIFTSAGADFVVGHHPHVRQAPEVINGVTVVYSIGNFMLSGQSGTEESRKGWVVELTIDNKEIKEYKLLDTEMNQQGVPSWSGGN